GREWGGEGEVRYDVLRDLEGRIGSRWLSSTLRSRRVPAAEPPVPDRAEHLSCLLLRGAARSARSDLLELALSAPRLGEEDRAEHARAGQSEGDQHPDADRGVDALDAEEEHHGGDEAGALHEGERDEQQPHPSPLGAAAG